MDLLKIENLTTMFMYIGIIATAIYFIKLLFFSISGADTDLPDGHIDLDGTDSDTAFSFLSIQSILAFFMGFGWAGLAAVKTTENFIAIFAAAIVAGLLLMGLSAYLTYLMKSLNKKETFDMNKIVGTVGKAYSTIQPKSNGQIEIEINSKLTVTDAFNDSEEEIKAFTPVKVIKYDNNIIYIVKE